MPTRDDVLNELAHSREEPLRSVLQAVQAYGDTRAAFERCETSSDEVTAALGLVVWRLLRLLDARDAPST